MNNFLSFKNRTVVDMTATGYQVLAETNVYNDMLKGVFLVGANASGKTNVIRALKLLLDLLFAEKNVNVDSQRCLFSSKKFLSLEYEFEIAGTKIKYDIQFEVINKSFIEKLYVQDQMILDRIGGNATSEITENKLYTNIDKNTLLLREIYFNTKFRNYPALQQWFDFLMHSIYVDGYRDSMFAPGRLNLELEDYLKDQGAEEINDFFQKFNFNQRIEYSKKSSGKITSIESVLNEKDIFFKREGVGEPIPFPWESLGNQKLLRLLPPFFHVVKNGGMLIIDEFSSGFHNFLEELLIRYFMKHTRNAQLFIVSHSTNLLTSSLLRPDQIYAVSFNGIDGSTVKRFSSEQPRVAQNFEKMYTSGVFGGVPEYSDVEN